MKRVLLFLLLAFGLSQVKGQIIITGFMGEPVGTDAPAGGGYEYIQFMATENIDFSVTPYAVVAASLSGGSAVAAGWAAGGPLSYKFNLQSGTVAKGSFFYVGNTKKMIAGAGSTDISETAPVTANRANWIRVKSRGEDMGDDNMGNPDQAGFLPGAANSAAGIGVFKGTAVTSTSVPIDAVFYGGKVGNAYIESNGNGYLIPKNDLYPNAVPGTTKFGQLNNTNLIGPGLTFNLNHFWKFGGVYNADTKTWVTPRSNTIITLTASSTLADIETGTGTATLPVTLASFTGKNQNNGVQLNWTTASEKNNNYFEVMRSSDGKNFKAIGRVQGMGNSDVVNRYSFTDKTPFPGTNYYQLNQFDFDGRSEAFTIIALNADLQQEQFKIKAVEDYLVHTLIYAGETSNARIFITDIAGRSIAEKSLKLEKGNNQHSIVVPTLQSGIYIASLVIDNKNISTIKFAK